jgi:hypothetical protein
MTLTALNLKLNLIHPPFVALLKKISSLPMTLPAKDLSYFSKEFMSTLTYSFSPSASLD